MVVHKMALLDIGRVCRKTKGQNAWDFCVIMGKTEGGFDVQSVDCKKMKVSGSHLEPTQHTVPAKNPVKELKGLKLD